ncbi:hypothetical protein D3C75_1233850 [compost metagenome]
MQDLERAEGHGFRLMGADQLPEILLAAFEALKRGFSRLACLPLQVIEHPPAIVAGLDAGTQKTAVAPSQTFGLLRQRRHQCGLLMGFNLEFNQLGEAAIFL